MKSLREPPPPRHLPTTSVDDVLELGAELADRDPFAGLSGSAKELLKAYAVLADEYAADAEHAGASWASDAEVARRIGSSKSTVRRARSELAEAAHLRVEYVAPFRRLPNGEASLHGTNVVTVLGLMVSATDANKKSAPRAAVTARGASPDRDRPATTPPEATGGIMGTLREQFSPSQAAALEARDAELRTAIVQQIERDSLTPMREEIRSLREELQGMRIEMGARIAAVAQVVERLVDKDNNGASGAGGAGGSSANGLENERDPQRSASPHNASARRRAGEITEVIHVLALPRAA